MEEETAHPAGLDDEELLAQCKVRRGRRSGPGGQHRNKVETAVVIRHLPTGATGEATERRSQDENRRKALFRLRLNLALTARSDSAKDAPSALWQSRCVGRRISVSRRHTDFPTLLAEALDVVTFHGGNTRSAAEFLGCTPTQLTRFIRTEPRALRILNDIRKDAGMRPLA